jgi:hypothetical protein
MFALSRSLLVAGATVGLTMTAGAMSQGVAATSHEAAQEAARQAAGQTADPAPAQATVQHIGTAAIAHIKDRDSRVVLLQVQQQLSRVTGIRDPRQADIDTLGRALDAARGRTIKREQMDAFCEALAVALATGSFDEVTLQRLAEDVYSALNNGTLTTQQGELLAADFAAALTDLGVQQPYQTLVLTALQGVCPLAVMPAQATGPNGRKTPAKRSLLILSRDSSN